MKIKEETQVPSYLQALAGSIADFFASRENSEQAVNFGKICERLAIKTTEGSTHLTPPEYIDLCSDPSIFAAVGSPIEGLPLVLTQNGNLYFNRFYQYEHTILQAISTRAEKPFRLIEPAVHQFFDRYVREYLDSSQALAVGVALQKEFCILTGGPGTGKTRTIAYILACQFASNADLRIALCAPTGKAANRMYRSLMQSIEQSRLPESSESALKLCSRTQTIHRLLGPVEGSVDFKHNADNPIPYDLVLVDEASMVDFSLMAKLCEALSPLAQLILVGDANQLSPVQGGAVFSGLVNGLPVNEFSTEQLAVLHNFSDIGSKSECPERLTGCMVSLTRTHRQDPASDYNAIGELCLAISKGDSADALTILKGKNNSLDFIEPSEDVSIDDLIKSGFNRLNSSTSPSEALAALGDFKILCAHNQGQYGVDHWNERAKSLLVNAEETPYPVVVGANDYSVGLFNGDDGVIMDSKGFFPELGDPRMVARPRLPKHTLGYACSIHRSQGSEYEQVLIVLPTKESRLLTRELLYVAVSRAKSKLILVGAKESLKAAINNVQTSPGGLLDFCD